MTDIKAAVANAIDFAKNTLGPERTVNLRLEEIESSVIDEIPVWLITLSTSLIEDGPLAAVRVMAAAMGADTRREYKVFTVSKETGEVLAMKIRLFQVPTK